MFTPSLYPRFDSLSCYVANLAGYLSAEIDAETFIARSTRLAVCTDLPDGGLAFSHHSYPLNHLPDGTRLGYAAAAEPEGLLAGVADELHRYGRVLVAADNTRLPWSPSRGKGAPAPHWLLIDGRRGDGWHAVDNFTGLLADGEQWPFAGWLSTAQLVDATTLPDRWTLEQERRNLFAFGPPTPQPTAPRSMWMRREPQDGSAAELPGTWLTEDADVLSFLADYFASSWDEASRYLDDMWTAAQHRVFKYRWLNDCAADLADADRERLVSICGAWEKLPSALRFALDSARRGRPRGSLVHTTFAHVIYIEFGKDLLLPPQGRGTS